MYASGYFVLARLVAIIALTAAIVAIRIAQRRRVRCSHVEDEDNVLALVESLHQLVGSEQPKNVSRNERVNTRQGATALIIAVLAAIVSSGSLLLTLLTTPSPRTLFSSMHHAVSRPPTTEETSILMPSMHTNTIANEQNEPEIARSTTFPTTDEIRSEVGPLEATKPISAIESRVPLHIHWPQQQMRAVVSAMGLRLVPPEEPIQYEWLLTSNGPARSKIEMAELAGYSPIVRVLNAGVVPEIEGPLWVLVPNDLAIHWERIKVNAILDSGLPAAAVEAAIVPAGPVFTLQIKRVLKR